MLGARTGRAPGAWQHFEVMETHSYVTEQARHSHLGTRAKILDTMPSAALFTLWASASLLATATKNLRVGHVGRCPGQRQNSPLQHRSPAELHLLHYATIKKHWLVGILSFGPLTSHGISIA